MALGRIRVNDRRAAVRMMRIRPDIRAPAVYPRRVGHGKVSGVEQSVVSRCACCGYRTGGGTCPVCFWTDDGSSDRDARVARGGPNGELSLDEARLNYAIYGASHRRYVEEVRDPRPDEQP